MLTSQMIKEAALRAGADKCGIAPISRLAGAPDVPGNVNVGKRECGKRTDEEVTGIGTFFGDRG